MSELADAIVELYEMPGCEVGGPLHVVVEDLNTGSELLDWCLAEVDNWLRDYAPEDEWEAIRTAVERLVDLLRPMPADEQEDALASAWDEVTVRAWDERRAREDRVASLILATQDTTRDTKLVPDTQD